MDYFKNKDLIKKEYGKFMVIFIFFNVNMEEYFQMLVKK